MGIGPIPMIEKGFSLHTREWERTARLGLEQVHIVVDMTSRLARSRGETRVDKDLIVFPLAGTNGYKWLWQLQMLWLRQCVRTNLQTNQYR